MPALPTLGDHSVTESCEPKRESRIKTQFSDQKLSHFVCWFRNIPNITIELKFYNIIIWTVIELRICTKSSWEREQVRATTKTIVRRREERKTRLKQNKKYSH